MKNMLLTFIIGKVEKGEMTYREAVRKIVKCKNQVLDYKDLLKQFKYWVKCREDKK